MHLLKETNIIIGGWISSGSTITALMLAYILNKRFVYAGGTHKFIADKLGYDSSSEAFIEYEIKYGEKWDLLWEKYVIWKLENERNIVANAKLAGFFTEHKPWLFEAFIIADSDTRNQRAGGEYRTEKISIRDNELNKRWKRLFGVNYMNVDEIRENHDYIIDNSDLGIAETTFQIFRVMRKALDFEELLTFVDFQKLEILAKEKGKAFFYEKLNDKNLLVSPPEIFRDWIENFDQELAETAKEWREIVEKYSSK